LSPNWVFSITLPYPPSLNRYWRAFSGRVILSKEARAYKATVARLCTGTDPHTDRVALFIRVYRPAKRGDVDNILKALLDAMQGHVYMNDSQVVELHVFRLDDKARPRVEVEVAAHV
jgi:crossover junction endodeoxyribonuclease RusA